MQEIMLSVSRSCSRKGSNVPGDIITVPDDEAARYVAAGQAEYVGEAPEGDGLDDLSVKQLTELAESPALEIKVGSKWRRDQIMDAIRTARSDEVAE